MKIAILFPGQGSQYLGMGQEFMNADPGCLEIMEKTESVCGVPLGKICLEGPMEELTRAKNLQPALAAVNLICWKMLKSRIGGRGEISFVAGHSLGEYSALHAAEVISLEDTIRLVAKRGSLMQREGELNPGGMRAVLGLTIADIEDLLATCPEEAVVTAANHNTEQQIVISGNLFGLDYISRKAEAAGAKVIPLNVSVANHSPLVANAVPDFSRYMADIPFLKPKVPVIFNITARPEDDVVKIKEMMGGQIASRVRWLDSIQYMLDSGVDTFIEVGPKSVLKGMMRKILPKGMTCTCLQFDTPETLEECLNKLG